MNTKSSVDKITSIIIIVLFMKVDKSKNLKVMYPGMLIIHRSTSQDVIVSLPFFKISIKSKIL